MPTEKANPFFTIPNRTGGWAISKSFPWGYDRFKMVGNPLLLYLSYTFFDVTSIFVMIYFQRYFYICNAIFFTMRYIIHENTYNVYNMIH